MPMEPKQSPGVAAIIIDDDPLVLRLFTRLFTRAGFLVESASDGQRGLELIQEKKPAIVLLDLKLPVLDGFEVLRRVRGNENIKKTPIVCFSGFGDRPGVVDECKKLGATECITKGSLPPEKVINRILQLLGKDHLPL